MSFHLRGARWVGIEDQYPYLNHRWLTSFSWAGEAGYTWESYAFGGIVRSRPDLREQFLTEWPSASVGKLYTHKQFEIWYVGECPGFEVRWLLPWPYIRDLFTASSWNGLVPTTGKAALEVPTQHAARFRVLEDGTLRIFGRCQCDAAHTDHIPDGWYDDEFGYLRPCDPEGDRAGFWHLKKIDALVVYSEARESRLWSRRYDGSLNARWCPTNDCHYDVARARVYDN